ncbi:MAG TPA: hypothetical protein VF896_11345 [Anaerolineales bacterium]
MEFGPQDQDVIKLLTKLKNADVAYPKDMLAARRQSYLNRMADIGSGVGANGGMKNAAKNLSSSSVSSITNTLLESALVIAIVAETSAVAYFYRDKVADFFKTITTASKIQEVTPPPAPTTLKVQGVSPSPAVTSTLPSATILASPTGSATSTPIPGVTDLNNGGVNQANSTPVPNGNNGNHYGQTPKPERTKQSTGNNDNSTTNNSNQNPNDKPPKNK